MANFKEQLERAKDIDTEIVSIALFDYIKSIKEDLIALNKKQLNEDSQDIFGEAIGFYSRATEIITKGEKKAGEPFDAKDTGQFLNKFYMTVSNGVFYFGSSDPKTDDILDSDNWLSHDLFGLTENNLNQVILDKFLPFVQNYYRKTLAL